MATIKVFTGPMGASKTTRLMYELNHYSTPSKNRVLLICHEGDCRNENGISTHLYGDDKLTLPVGRYVDIVRVKNLSDITSTVYIDECGIEREYSMIGIDESQFFDDLLEFVKSKILKKGLTIIVAGLSFDKNNEPFGQTSLLLPYATHFEKYPAVCSKCDYEFHSPAAYTICNDDSKDQVIIGGMGLYEPRCAFHFFE